MAAAGLNEGIVRNGFAIVAGVVDAAGVAAVIDALGGAQELAGLREKNGRVYARRNLLSTVPRVKELAEAPPIRRLLEPILGRSARAVRGLLFDKTPEANWKVAWHQDLSVAVRRREDEPGYGPWSIKSGVVHVQPPVEVLKGMITVRLSLDDCGPDNGPLKVLPGSHAAGVLSPAEVEDWRRRVPPVDCHVPAGGVLLMRPLLLHASSPAASPGRRRVVHLEYAAADLPGKPRWHTDGPD